MDTPRKWQVASVATAVASMSLGGLLLARPTSEAVAPIELDGIVDDREVSVASPTDVAGPPTQGEGDDHRIVTPEAPTSLAEVETEPPPADTTDSPTEPTTTRSTSPTPPRSTADADDADSPEDADDVEEDDVEEDDDPDDDADDDIDSPDEDDSIDSP